MLGYVQTKHKSTYLNVTISTGILYCTSDLLALLLSISETLMQFRINISKFLKVGRGLKLKR